ncbi:LOW QUALITY PROTEIN: epithelial cell adhesion molecule [Micropterus salmoides]|uniref:LOW QUALITY PROTEIN: epithelial cell adhesion molecule n=1 Tax=Micropterus salmoides TaxID=27706 RepID=UPI0018EB50B9|nr:LOW QUALITY PROTEIN: epithelial cell adhesion molecule [Micropterus salmoides]
MNIWIALVLTALAAGASAQDCSCNTMKWATCDGNPCVCYLMIGDTQKQTLNCSALIPKCFLMKAEMYRAKKGLSVRGVGGKPVETAFVDNDGIYDPECENDGKFKAKQCNNTEECWCVNSAGVRRTDKGDKSIKCDKLVETYWIRLQLTHKKVNSSVDKNALKTAIGQAIKNRYASFNPDMVKEVEYDPDARMIVVDVKKPIGERNTDLTQMAYYMEKDVKVLPLFKNEAKFAPLVGTQNLEMENILVYYVDEEAPTFTMKNLSGGIIAVIVVVVLAVIAGLLVLFFAKRREKQRYNKAQQRELDPM